VTTVVRPWFRRDISKLALGCDGRARQIGLTPEIDSQVSHRDPPWPMEKDRPCENAAIPMVLLKI
jgi:hypothetical protein